MIAQSGTKPKPHLGHNQVRRALIDQIVPEAFGFVEEAFAFRADLIAGQFSDLFKQFALFRGQAGRGFHGQIDQHVPTRRAAKNAHPFAAQTQTLTRLAACLDLDLGATTIDGRNFDLAAERRLVRQIIQRLLTAARVLMEVDAPAEAAEATEGLRPHDARYISVRAHVEL